MQLHYVVVHIDVVALQDEVVMPSAAFLKDMSFPMTKLPLNTRLLHVPYFISVVLKNKTGIASY